MMFRLYLVLGLTVFLVILVVGCIVVVVQSDTGIERLQTEPPRM
jgi:hypothetical protein